MRAAALTDRDRALSVLRVLGGGDDDATVRRAWSIEAQLAGGDDGERRDAGGLIAAIRERRAAGYRIAARDVWRACGVSCARDLAREWPTVAVALADPVPAPRAGVQVAAPTVAWPTRDRGVT
jgi:hypothetical protein